MLNNYIKAVSTPAKTPNTPASTSSSSSRITILSTPVSANVGGTVAGLGESLLNNYSPAIMGPSKSFVSFATFAGIKDIPMSYLGNSLKVAGNGIAAISIGPDIGNTLTARNSNTNGQRAAKVGIQLVGAALGLGTGSAGGYLIGVGAVNLWNSGGWIMMGIGAGVIISGRIFMTLLKMHYIKNLEYNKEEIL